jgi:penicillin amidase
VSDLRAEFGSDDVSAWTRSAAVDELDNMSLFGMPVGVADPGDMPLQKRGTENHFVRLGNDSKASPKANKPFVAENVLPPGNSGYVAPDGTTDEHYADQLQAFVDFRYKRLRFTDAEVNRDLESTRTIRSDGGEGHEG